MEIYGNIWITPYNEDLLVDALEHVFVPAEDCLDHQVVDTGLDSACVVTLIMMMMMTKMTMMMMKMIMTSFSRYFQNVCRLHLCPENSEGASLCSKSSLYLFTLVVMMMVMMMI